MLPAITLFDDNIAAPHIFTLARGLVNTRITWTANAAGSSALWTILRDKWAAVRQSAPFSDLAVTVRDPHFTGPILEYVQLSPAHASCGA